ncbi:MAG: hypothetical protein MJ183_01825 [Treponemataceae bacterium]|nr:hypothetical protein [Treponemataceae bacterium]
MRILILSFLKSENTKHNEILKKLSTAAESKGHEVRVQNGITEQDQIHLAIYDYIAVVVPASPLFGAKVHPKLPEVLSQCGNPEGKKGCALVVKSGFMSQKMVRVTMRAMEREGMKLDYFEVIENVDHAAYVGKKIG